MTVKKSKKRARRVTSPLVQIIDGEAFQYAYGVYVAAATCRMPTDAPSSKRIILDIGDGETLEARLTDTPFNLGMKAVCEEFDGHGAPFRVALMSRIMALGSLLATKEKELESQDLVRKDGANLLVSSDLIAACGTARLSESDDVFRIADVLDVIDAGAGSVGGA
jgi:hypothetical protein